MCLYLTSQVVSTAVYVRCTFCYFWRVSYNGIGSVFVTEACLMYQIENDLLQIFRVIGWFYVILKKGFKKKLRENIIATIPKIKNGNIL